MVARRRVEVYVLGRAAAQCRSCGRAQLLQVRRARSRGGCLRIVGHHAPHDDQLTTHLADVAALALGGRRSAPWIVVGDCNADLCAGRRAPGVPRTPRLGQVSTCDRCLGAVDRFAGRAVGSGMRRAALHALAVDRRSGFSVLHRRGAREQALRGGGWGWGLLASCACRSCCPRRPRSYRRSSCASQLAAAGCCGLRGRCAGSRVSHHAHRWADQYCCEHVNAQTRRHSHRRRPAACTGPAGSP